MPAPTACQCCEWTRSDFPFTTFMGNANVLSVAAFDNHIYAGTEEGIYRTLTTNNRIEDFSTWEFLGADQGFPADYSCKDMAIYKGQLYMGINEDVYRFANETPTLFYDQESAYAMQYLSAEGSYLLAGFRCVGGGCGNGQVRYLDENAVGGTLASGCLGVPIYAIEDQFGRFWFGDEWMGFRWLDNTTDEICNTFEINSPFSQEVWTVDVTNDEVWISTGAYTPTRTPVALDKVWPL
ncbi:MAG: hypothetical protein R2795_03440 [Saprospiraceae bacterium]